MYIMYVSCLPDNHEPLDVHPPIAGGMHALESKGHTPLICGIRFPFFCVVGQPSVWSTLVVGSGALVTPVTLQLGPLLKTYWL